MSEQETAISLPGGRWGLAWGGRQTAEFMIAEYRKYAQYQYDKAKAVLEAPDEAFHIETYLGPFAQKRREIIQEGNET